MHFLCCGNGSSIEAQRPRVLGGVVVTDVSARRQNTDRPLPTLQVRFAHVLHVTRYVMSHHAPIPTHLIISDVELIAHLL